MFSFSEIIKNPGVIAMIVIVGLLLFVLVPILISRAIKGSKTARNYIPDLIRMSGLQPAGKTDFTGNYKGFTTLLRMGLGVNNYQIAHQTIHGLTGGKSNLHSPSIFYQKFYIEIDLPKPVPATILREKISMLRTDQFINDKIAGKDYDLPEIKTNSKLKRVHIFGTDQQLAEKIASDGALKNMMENWHYTDIRISGEKLQFSLDDNMVNPTFGPIRTSKPQFIIDGLNIAAKVAEVVSR